MDAYGRGLSVSQFGKSASLRGPKYEIEGIGKVSNNSVGRYGIEGWMDGWPWCRSVGRPHEIEGRSRDAAAASTSDEGGKPFLTYLTFIIHAPCSGETRGGKRAELFHCRRCASLCARDLACRKRRVSPSFLRMRGERHECQSDVKASQFNSGLRP